MPRIGPLLAAAAVLITVACDVSKVVTLDPLQEMMRARLGPENPSVPVGALHRPGQPCALCHQEAGGASVFTVAGTVYRDDQSEVALADVAVLMIDSAGTKFTARTNCAGNFWTRPQEFAPRWPLWVTMEMGEHKIDMESPIGREASCALCHTHPVSQTSAGRVFLTDDPVVIPTIVPRACRPDEAAR